ncbi:hypothetical protein AAZX31_15G215500 [Glycine max]|uniref:Protein LNK3 n=2 Tax=Glycine subgen. Soja TaxID=1462606 RepID=K7MDA5_SOYBN|nr:protein LNK3 [Glycine max]XP_028205157.1 protein LNK3-like [Glycine soja]KAH1148497.1 hypothetical protein GYH30_043225 [Glycine max]KHN32851.1 hypothetical protein glysoja_038780 [Glycine soja]KRH13301.1 hypothetical protein GLYMA_15G229400v4 [Glycine max]RZB65880.1 Protein LNK3 [Glycine soja]|eukprot:XP_003545816.2 protein LNK3 [Glycine max]
MHLTTQQHTIASGFQLTSYQVLFITDYCVLQLGLFCFHQSKFRSSVLSLFCTKAIERLFGMDWYYGCESSDLLVSKDQENLLERHPSPENWSEWGINAPEGFNSPQEYLIMDTDETEVEFNFIDESFNNEIEFDPCQYDKDQSSSSSACGGFAEQSFQQMALTCDHQLQDRSTFKHTDDIFLDSVLEDFPCVENLHKSFSYLENQCSNTTGGVQKDIAASGFVPCNSDSKDCLDIEDHAVKVLDTFEQSNGDDTMLEQLSLEEYTLQAFEMLIAQFTEKTRISFRDALYRLARNTKQHVIEDLDGGLNMHQEMPDSVYHETMRSEDNKPMESESNSVDRAVANLMFNKMEINILDLPLTTLVNLKQEVIGSKCLLGKSSKSLDVTQ